MGNHFAPLGISVAVILFIGLVFPFILSMFINVEDVKPSSFAATLSDTVENGITFTLPVVGSVSINPFSLLGTTVKTTLHDSFVYLGLLPNFIVIFIVVMCSCGIIYTLIKFIPTEG